MKKLANQMAKQKKVEEEKAKKKKEEKDAIAEFIKTKEMEEAKKQDAIIKARMHEAVQEWLATIAENQRQEWVATMQ